MMNYCMNVGVVDESASVAASVSDVDIARTRATTTSEFVHLTETRGFIYRAIAAIQDESFNFVINRLLRQFEGAIREELEAAQNSPLLCRKLARQIIGLTELISSLKERRALESWSSSRERWCYIVANYIACELCGAQDRVEREHFIIERIGSMLSLYVERGDAGSGVHKENTLRTLIAVPKLFGQANIITVFYSRLFPQWSTAVSVFSQAELPDKIYIEYIIIFYYWQRLERNEATKQRIVEFAVKFMRPTSTLPYNPAYMEHLPKYTDPSMATRCILEHLSLKQCCRGLHAASRLDNRPLQPNDLIIDSDEEDAASGRVSMLVNVLTSTQLHQPTPPPVPDPPHFLKRLCRNASRLEPVKRATALFRGIDSTCEVVDLCESDEEEEMFSLDFSVPANVDGNGSNSNEAAAVGDDDYVPITRIYPSNLRTYQRATSSATTLVSPATTIATYTMPRIVNSYSCRRDSLHLVSTTQVAPHLVDQCVQTAEQEEEQQQQQEPLLRFANVNNAISSCKLYSDMRPSDSSTTTEPIHKGTHNRRKCNDNHHCQQQSSRNSHSSEASLNKKQVKFSAQHLGASGRTQLIKSLKAIKPSIKRYKNINNASLTSPTPPTPSSSMDYIESLKWMGRKEHLLAGQRMFSKLESKKHCDKGTIESSSCCRRERHAAAGKQTCSTTSSTPTPTNQLTPTTSNASSGTPTPQLNRRQTQGPQRSLPTPPASTHSSIDTYRRRRKSTDGVQNSTEIEQVLALGRKYKFDRRKFADSSMEHVNFYNSLLKLQRRKMHERRKLDVEVSQPKSEPKTKKQIRATNSKLRQDIEKLESDLEIIKSFAVQARAKATATTPETMPTPVVRLKRVHIEDFAISHSSNEDTNEAMNQLVQPNKSKANRRRRRKLHCWSRVKNVYKKKRLAQLAADLPVSATDTPATPSVTPVPAAVLSPAPATAHESASRSASVADDLDCIAAYVTLANNGECCSEEDAVVKQITRVFTPSPEADPCSVVAAHEIVVASTNVPVYLLNGESRDVTTPLPASLSIDAVASEPENGFG